MQSCKVASRRLTFSHAAFLRRAAVATVCLLVAVAAAAGEGNLTLEEAFDMSLEELMTVSIAAGTLRQLAGAPAIATVSPAQDIWTMGATELDGVVEAVPDCDRTTDCDDVDCASDSVCSGGGCAGSGESCKKDAGCCSLSCLGSDRNKSCA